MPANSATCCSSLNKTSLAESGPTPSGLARENMSKKGTMTASATRRRLAALLSCHVIHVFLIYDTRAA